MRGKRMGIGPVFLGLLLRGYLTTPQKAKLARDSCWFKRGHVREEKKYTECSACLSILERDLRRLFFWAGAISWWVSWCEFALWRSTCFYLLYVNKQTIIDVAAASEILHKLSSQRVFITGLSKECAKSGLMFYGQKRFPFESNVTKVKFMKDCRLSFLISLLLMTKSPWNRLYLFDSVGISLQSQIKVTF